MQMYLDTVADGMTVWPIYAFPYAARPSPSTWAN